MKILLAFYFILILLILLKDFQTASFTKVIVFVLLLIFAADAFRFLLSGNLWYAAAATRLIFQVSNLTTLITKSGLSLLVVLLLLRYFARVTTWAQELFFNVALLTCPGAIIWASLLLNFIKLSFFFFGCRDLRWLISLLGVIESVFIAFTAYAAINDGICKVAFPTNPVSLRMIFSLFIFFIFELVCHISTWPCCRTCSVIILGGFSGFFFLLLNHLQEFCLRYFAEHIIKVVTSRFVVINVFVATRTFLTHFNECFVQWALKRGVFFLDWNLRLEFL